MQEKDVQKDLIVTIRRRYGRYQILSNETNWYNSENGHARLDGCRGVLVQAIGPDGKPLLKGHLGGKGRYIATLHSLQLIKNGR